MREVKQRGLNDSTRGSWVLVLVHICLQGKPSYGGGKLNGHCGCQELKICVQ